MRHSKAFNTGVGLVTCVCVLTVFTLPAGAAAIIFRKVDTFTIEGTKEKKHDARLELDTEKRLLLVVDEKRGAEKMTYAAIPYDAVTGLSYSRSAHPRAKSGIALGVVSLGIGLLVGFLAKGKKHWFTIEFEGMLIHIDPELSRRLKHLSVDEDKTLQQLGVEALERLLASRSSA